MRKKTVTLILLALCFVLLFGALLSACDTKEKTAIIILPGLMGSGLYDSESGEPVWDPFKEGLDFSAVVTHSGSFGVVEIAEYFNENTDYVTKILRDALHQEDSSFLRKLAVDKDGNPLNPNIKPADESFSNPKLLRYGTLGTMKEMYTNLKNRYGSKAEVMVYSYDWRVDNRINAEKLEKFINDKGYKKVVFLTHSMGGNLASYYLARSEANRDKCAALISFGSPYYGSLTALTTLEDKDSYAYDLVGDFVDIDLVALLLQSIAGTSSVDQAKDMLFNVIEEDFLALMNIVTLYQLLPTYDLLNTYQYRYEYKSENYTKQTSFIKINDKYMTFTRDELYEFYASRPWAKHEDGSMKKQVLELKDYWDDMMVTLPDGSKVHSTSLVNALYISGSGYKTRTTVNYTADYKEDGSIDYSTLKYDGNTYESTELGDGTVLLYSAAPNRYSSDSNVKIITLADHYDIAIPFMAFSAKITFHFLDKVIF
ncbi:MAG: hypothetical protein GX891_03285 [Clostridiales bacterium]|nr:hypothetical protein [Clostridiales bacterium]